MSTALYRRYRPETFADVIGQEHVTDPLMSALRGDRISHAYLFSGPRGCGKTTSARIFARCLNCEQGPTDTPCGTCPSCVDLARDGAGSLDVVEMDAASHGGVDDARELRERAAFAPARDRYKIFIIDEAHMVTNQGFNALLKLVEEPPAHVKFVFATTEPEKVIGTIRSRTHHYPFRLVPPQRLQAYLEELSAAENVSVDAGVLPLVVRAGGGSVRDSLSVLDQLIAGAQEGTIGYERAVALLGYTHATLLDDVVDAIAATDGAALFRVVDRVIGSGHDPRRFAEDLLERLRDLIVIAVSGEHAGTALRSLPQDQFDRMRIQAQQLGPAQLSRAGDLVNEALSEMSGATSPRLQLELLCARLLLPAAGDAARGFGARLERLENSLAGGQGAAPAASGGTAAPQVQQAERHAPAAAAVGGPAQEAQSRPPQSRPQPTPEQAGPEQAGPEQAAPEQAAHEQSDRGQAVHPAHEPPADGQPARHEPPADDRPARQEAPADGQPARQEVPGGDQPARQQAPVDAQPIRQETQGGGRPAWQESAGSAPSGSAAHDSRGAEPQQDTPSGPAHGDGQQRTAPQAPAAPSSAPSQSAAGGTASVDTEMVRRRWPEVLATLARFKRTTWALVSQNAQVADVSGGVLHLAFTTSGLAHTFRSGQHAEPLQRALSETLGVDVRIEPVLSPAAEADGGSPQRSTSTGWGAPPPADGADSSAASGGAASAWGAASPRQDAGLGDRPAPGAGASTQGPGAPTSTDGPPSAHRPGGASSPHAADGAGHSSAATLPAGGRADGSGWGAPAGDAAADGRLGPSSSAPATSAAAAGGGAAGATMTAVPQAGTASPASSASSWTAPTPPSAPHVAPADDTPSMDDPNADNSELSGAKLIERLLGGIVIEEIED